MSTDLLPETTGDDLLDFLEIMKNTPLRTMADIAADREPEFEIPVLAVGMQADTVEIPVTRPAPRHLATYRGPRVWRHPLTWLKWNFGWLYWGVDEQNRHRSHRMV
jgi:hypothetical protein